MGHLQNWLILSLVLLSLCLSPDPTMGTPLYTTDLYQSVVLDSMGNPLEPGAEYYIAVSLPLKIVVGVTRAPKSIGQRCPLYAISMMLGDWQNGQPVRFIPTNPSQTQIRERVDQVKIDSGFSPMCRDNGIWRMMPNPTSGQLEVVASGAYNVPESSFRLRRVDQLSSVDGPTYTINYCIRRKCSPLVTTSGHDNFRGMLGLPLDNQHNAQPLQVYFIKKTTTETLAFDI